MDNPIRVDDREKKPAPAETVGYLARHDIEGNVERLGVGDFSFQDAQGGLVLVTRKANDLFDSLYSHHLDDELTQCIGAVKAYGSGSVWFMLDGVFVPTQAGGMGVYTTTGNSEWLHLNNERASSPRLMETLYASAQAVGVFVIPTIYPPAALRTIYERAQKVTKTGLWPSNIGKRIPRPALRWHSNTSKVARLMAVWPRLTERPASLLIAEYGSVWEVLFMGRTEPQTLLNITGIGQKGIENLREAVL